MSWIKKLFFNIYYLGSPPWDTGITPPELVEFIQSHQPGRALDLGCGTGTNVLALAAAEWEACGVDFSGRAIRAARRKAKSLKLKAAFFKDDVVRLKDVKGTFDLVFDIGCFHSLPKDQHEGYAHNVSSLLTSNGTFMLYVFFRSPDSNGTGIRQEELDETFKSFDLIKREDGENRGERKSAWLWFRLPANST